MLSLNLSTIAEYTNGKLNDKKFSDININIVSIDTRTIEKGDLFIPIIGEKFDGHVFIEKAFNNGAIAALSEEGKFESKEHPIIYVEDVNLAFKDLAMNYRNSLNTKIIALTGSNGKTTTKDLIYSVLENNFNTKKTIGNLNNQIGVPRTLLRFGKDTEIGVVEMGTDSFGEIEILSKMALPDIAIITNIGDSHLDVLKTKKNIAKEKLHIIDGLDKNGIFIYNNDDDILRNAVSNKKIIQKAISFGTREDSDYKIKTIESNNQGSVFSINNTIYNITLIGKHQVYNSAIAIIIADIFNIDTNTVIKSLAKKDLTKMRSELLACDGFDILNDSYKSNPQSLRSALETLNLLNGYTQKIAILGDMLELGDDEEKLHREIGKEISPDDVDYLLLYGELSKYIADEAIKNFPKNRVFHFDKKDALIDKAKTIISKNTIVLVKASRSLRLEEIVEALEEIHLN